MKLSLKFPVVYTLAVLSLTVGCTKKREAKLPDGAGRYTDSVSNYSQKSYPLQTLGPITDGKGEDAKLGQSIDRKSDVKAYGIKTLPMVNFKTEAKVPEGTRLYAQPNTNGKYWIEYQLTNDLLVVHKVAAMEDLPLDERTIAENSETKPGLKRVPLVGYPIVAKVVREVAKNEIGQKTSRLEDRSVPNIQDAQYVQIDFTKPSEFAKVDKKDVLPVDYLKGDWYFGQTIIAAPDVLAGYVSENTSADLSGFERYYSAPAQSIVRFNRTEKGIEILGAVVAAEGQSNIKNLPQLAFLPATSVSFKRKALGANQAFAEEEDKEVPWQKTPYLKIDWNGMNAGLLTNTDSEGQREVGSHISGTPKLAFIQIEDNFLSLSYDLPGSNIRVQVSFWRTTEHAKISKDYVRKGHFESDWNKFGYFTVSKPITPEHHKLRTVEDYDNARNLTRFNPKMGKVVWYLSEGAPDWVIPSARYAVAEWNKAFQEAGTGLTIELNETERKSVGDIRYNVLNFIGNASTSGGGSLGVAGFILDPFTGEIISSKANVWHDNVKKDVVNDIDYYIRAKAGFTPDTNGVGVAGLAEQFYSEEKSFKQSLSKEEAKLSAVDLGIKLITGQTLQELKGQNIRKADIPALTKSYYASVDFRKRTSSNRAEFDAQVTRVPNIDVDVARHCPELQAAIENYKQTKSDTVRINAAEKCGLALSKALVVPFIVHEMGHAFGLRHNFRGSVDKKNWLTPEQNGTAYPSYSSSIMEYSSWEDWRIMKPGPYDVAALRFGYADAIGLDNGTAIGQSVKIDPSKSIAQNLSQMGQTGKEKSFMFCTDEHVQFIDPLCNRWDAGTTPSEVVDFYIKEVNNSFLLSQYRLDNARLAGDSLSVRRVQGYMIPMMKIYGTWRTILNDYMKNRLPYLEGVSKEVYEKEILEKMKADPVYGPKYAEYRPAAEKIYKFFKGLAMLPNRYCAFKDNGTGKLNVLEVSKLRGEIFKSTGESVSSCKQPAAVAFFAKNNATVQAEFGYHVDGLRYDMTADSVTQPFDVYPTFLDRLLASNLITARGVWTYQALEKNFFPNMMDEPSFREDWMNTLMKRSVNGLSAASLDAIPDVKKQLGNQKLQDSKEYFSLFNAEKDLLSTSAVFMKNGLWIPGNIAASLDRMKVIGGRLASTNASEKDATKVAGGMSFSSDPEAIYSQMVIMKYLQINALKTTDLKKFAPIIKALDEAKLPQDDKEMDNFKGSNMVELAPKLDQAINTVAQANGQEAKDVIQEFASIYGQDIILPAMISMNLYGQIAKADKEAQAASPEDKAKWQEQLKKVLGTPIKTFFKDIKAVSLKKAVADAEAAKAEVLTNGDEADAHLHVLLNILLLNYVDTGM